MVKSRKKRYIFTMERHKLRYFLLFVVAALGLSGQVSAQIYKPFTDLKVIKTEKFDIIFPEASRATAERLATFADETYDQVSKLLGIKVSSRIPVSITPQTQQFNGYMNLFPYPHIVLYDTPMDIEWTTFSDSLEGLFLHELTHAVSLSSRGPFLDFLHGVFGGWVAPTVLTTPPFMVEGITVSFESRSGFGRTNDPLVKEHVRQAIRDNKFLDPFQASEIYDLSTQGAPFYEYGGLFNAYIQKRWGMEKYSELWKAMGSSLPLSLDYYKYGFNGIFKNVYGVDIREAWADFRASLTLLDLEDVGRPIIPGKETRYAASATGGGKVYFLESAGDKVMEFDPKTSYSRIALDTDITAYDLDVSPAGDKVLISGYRYEGAIATATVVEYDLSTKTKTGRYWKGIYRGRYFRDGLLALASERHTNRIVYVDAQGGQKVLLKGGDSLLFSAPAPVDGDRFAFIAAEKGVRSLGLYDMRSGAAERIVSDLGDDQARWKYIRGLHASGDSLYFSYVNDDRFYKLGSLNLSTGKVAFSSRDFNGGIFNPVETGGAILYVGQFTTWDRAFRYPLSATEFAEGSDGKTTIAAVRTEPWALPGGEDTEVVAPSAQNRSEKAYSALPYLNPFSFWLPYPILRSDGSKARIDGGGIISFMSDPTDMNTVFLQAGWDARNSMVDAKIEWTTLSLGLPLALTGSDTMEFSDSLNDASRVTRFNAALLFQRGLGGENKQLLLKPFVAGVLNADDPGDDRPVYQWKYNDGKSIAGMDLVLSNRRKTNWQLLGSGTQLQTQIQTTLPGVEVRTLGLVEAAFEPDMPMEILAYGLYDQSGITVDGRSGVFGSAIFEGMTEYRSDASDDHKWVTGGQLEMKVFSIETQTNLSHLYFNRIFGTASWKGAVYGGGSVAEGPGSKLGPDARFIHALSFKVGAVMGANPLAMIPFRFTPYLWYSLKLSGSGGADGYKTTAYGGASSLGLVARFEY